MGTGLHEQAPYRGRLGRSGHNWEVQGVGCELAQQVVADATTDHVNDIYVLSREGANFVDRSPVGESQAVEDAPHECGGCLWQRLPTLRASVGYSAGHVARRQEYGIVDVDDGS